MSQCLKSEIEQRSNVGRGQRTLRISADLLLSRKCPDSKCRSVGIQNSSLAKFKSTVHSDKQHGRSKRDAAQSTTACSSQMKYQDDFGTWVIYGYIYISFSHHSSFQGRSTETSTSRSRVSLHDRHESGIVAPPAPRWQQR